MSLKWEVTWIALSEHKYLQYFYGRRPIDFTWRTISNIQVHSQSFLQLPKHQRTSESDWHERYKTAIFTNLTAVHLIIYFWWTATAIHSLHNFKAFLRGPRLLSNMHRSSWRHPVQAHPVNQADILPANLLAISRSAVYSTSQFLETWEAVRAVALASTPIVAYTCYCVSKCRYLLALSDIHSSRMQHASMTHGI